jgi:hypothetical protein
MRSPYPPIEPYSSGLLDVGDGHQIYWELCGSPDGEPATVLHGRPDAGCSAKRRRPAAEVQFVGDAGYAAGGPGVLDRPLAATDRLAAAR